MYRSGLSKTRSLAHRRKLKKVRKNSARKRAPIMSGNRRRGQARRQIPHFYLSCKSPAAPADTDPVRWERRSTFPIYSSHPSHSSSAMQSIPSSKLVLTLTASALAAFGTVTLQAAGVTAGLSSLIGPYDYTDTFTGTADGGRPDRPYIPAVQPAAAYVVENTYGHPSVNFQSGG